MIELKNISRTYESNKTNVFALKDINLVFNKKEFVSILGPSGCGKTTLLNIIGGLDKYDSGNLYVDGIDTTNYKEKDWDRYRNNRIGFVFQSFNLVEHLSVIENVEMSLTLLGVNKKERRKKALTALDRVGISKLYKKLPKYLSGGEKQRVAIARAIVNDPEVILADEPTGALDSENSIQIMKILKEISNDRLVIMVTHNKELADSFSSRIINLFDGKVICDSNTNKKINEEFDDVSETEKIKGSKMSFFKALSLSFKNLKMKWVRTLLTTLAGSIGIIGVGLVIAVSTGVTRYINDVQRVALGNYPITISSSVKSNPSSSIKDKYEEYSNEKKINIIKGQYLYEHINVIEDDFIDYLNKLDNNLYSWINYNTSIEMTILSKDSDDYCRSVYTSYLYEMTDDKNIVSNDYDVLEGKMPTEKDEIAIVIDKYNCVNANMLYYMGIDYNRDYVSFEEMLNKKFKLILNDDLFIKQGDKYYIKGSSYYKELYENSGLELKIVGVLRNKKNSTSEIYSSCYLYTKQLTDYVYETNMNSEIVKEQLKYGLDKDVTTGRPFEDYVGMTSTQTKEYQYESLLKDLGVVKEKNRIYVYTNNFEERMIVEKYIDEYYNKDSNVVISYTDYMKRITEEFTTFVKILTKVLIIFALISLLVSGIMTGIISYISVLERTKEIGILRSIGARRIDVARIFVAETTLIGLLSGIFGIIGAIGLSNPISNLVKSIIEENASVTTGLKTFKIVQFETRNIILIILGSVILTVISGLVPTIIASLKKPINALKGNDGN